MYTFNSFEQDFRYSEDDSYIRAVRFNMIRKNGDIKVSAFKSNHGGVSVTRTNEIVYEKAMAYMRSYFEGIMALFPVRTCADNDIFEIHSPSPGHNMHHWELFGDSQKNELTLKQIMAILQACLVEK